MAESGTPAKSKNAGQPGTGLMDQPVAHLGHRVLEVLDPASALGKR